MVSSEVYDKLTLLNELETKLTYEVDKEVELYKYYKIGSEKGSEELNYLSLRMKSLCSGYCEVDGFIDRVTIKGEQPECKVDKKEERTFWGDHLRYKKCILEKTFNCETNKCKEAYEWMYSPDPHNM